MPPCGICQTWVLSTCSGPSMRRPMKTLPSRLNTARPAQGRYGKESNEAMQGELGQTQGTGEYRIALREIQVVLCGPLGVSAAGVAMDERFLSGARPRQARSDRPFLGCLRNDDLLTLPA